MDNSLVFCALCGVELDDNTSVLSGRRKPCPMCGSKRRKFGIVRRGTMSFKKKLRTKGRHSKGGRPFIEQVSDDNLRRKSGEWMKLSRVMDRDNDIYHEVIIDPRTDQIICKCEEPISKHRGYGSAKHKRKKEIG